MGSEGVLEPATLYHGCGGGTVGTELDVAYGGVAGVYAQPVSLESLRVFFRFVAPLYLSVQVLSLIFFLHYYVSSSPRS